MDNFGKVVEEAKKLNVKIAFENSSLATYNPFDGNMLQLLNQGPDYEASITVFNVGLGESFGIENVYMDYSGVYDWSIESTVQVADVNGTLSQRGDTTFIHASVIGFNAIQYDVELWYTAPTPIDTVEIEMPIEFFNDMENGFYTLASYTPDNEWYISVSPITDKVSGTFVNDGLFGKFGADGGRYDFYSGNTFIYSEEHWENYPIEKGTLVVESTTDGKITAEAHLLARNAVLFHIKMTSQYNTHLEYDEPEIEVDRTYTTDDIVFIEDQIEDNGYIYLSLTAADGSDMAAFFFFADEADEDIIIPVGVYPIDSSEDYGTVMANPGVDGYNVWPSYYAEMLDGGLVVPLWLLVGGTVEVSKDEEGNAHLEVNAVNSYGVEVHIVYDGTTTGLDEVRTTVSGVKKVIQNGQFIIIRNGEEYNAIGSSL